MIRKKPQDDSFTSGTLAVYRTKNSAPPGGMPTEDLEFKISLRYEERTVGVTRYYTAMQHDQKIDRVVRCPRVSIVQALDVAKLPDGVYLIRQVQYPTDTAIPEMDLSLERDVCGAE